MSQASGTMPQLAVMFHETVHLSTDILRTACNGRTHVHDSGSGSGAACMTGSPPVSRQRLHTGLLTVQAAK